MKFAAFESSQAQEITALFQRTFTDSEGENEGSTVAVLVHNLIQTTADEDLYGFCAYEGSEVVACVFFSRLSLADDTVAFLLSPMAVVTQHQHQGIGQCLIRHALEQLKADGVALVATYGDPDFYSRVGFVKVSQQQLEAPFELTYPGAWLAQSLISGEIPSVQGVTQCVEAFGKHEYW